jgi:hypothetical protein
VKEHLGAFGAHDLALLGDWLNDTGELYIDVYWPHSGGSGVEYVVRSLPDLKRVVSNHAGQELILTILREKCYPLRGLVNDDLIAQAMQLIQDGSYYEILDWGKLLDVDKPFPGVGTTLEDGNTHDELQEHLAGLIGREVAVGTNPFDYHDTDYFFERPEEVFVLKVARDLSVKKNWSSYAPYDQDPVKYQPLVKAWNE